MTFTSWLRKQKKRQDPVGDLARDATAQPLPDEKPWPQRAKTFRAYERCLEENDACEGAFRALRRAWDEWQAATNPEPPNIND